MTDDENIRGFSGENDFLSNFYMVNIEIDDKIYKSSEHYYMSQKTTDDRWRQKILEAPTGAKAKRIGTQVPLRADWVEKYKLQSMRIALQAKFCIHEMKNRLDATGNKYLEETNHWNDVFWGVCNGEGRNILGIMLMIIRENNRGANDITV